MNKFKSFISTKGFYVALTIGVVAFASLIGIYEYRANCDKYLGDNEIDLNQSYIEGKVLETEDTEVENLAKEESSPAASDKVENVDSTKDNQKDKLVNENSPLMNGTANNENNDKDVASDTDTLKGFDESETMAWPLVNTGIIAGETDASSTGSIVIPYSMDTTVYFETLGVYKCNPGVLLRGREGDNVYAVYSGKVTKVEDTKEFGTVVTIDMGNGYIAKYGQLMNVCVNENDSVTSGDNIAEIAAVTNYYEKEGNHLYLAITKDGIPVDPMTLIE